MVSARSVVIFEGYVVILASVVVKTEVHVVKMKRDVVIVKNWNKKTTGIYR